MDRLTVWDGGLAYFPLCIERCDGHPDYSNCANCPNYNEIVVRLAEIVVRLAAIEDILGDTYDLDHLRDLMKADGEGRLFAPPCKPGDPIWFINHDEEICDEEYYADVITEVGTRGFWLSYLMDKPDNMDVFISWDEIGKTAFLTYEDAKAALKGVINGHQ